MITPPPNPKQAAARASIMAYQGKTVIESDETTPPPPALSALLPRCIAHWPDMQRYAESACIEPLQHDAGWCWGCSVTVFDKSEVMENLRLCSIELEQDLL